jgi:hypothetical protein
MADTSGTAISHYDGAGGALAWTGEGSGEAEKWTRNIPGMGGALTGLQTGEGKTGGAVVLQLHDLQGNIVGEASSNEMETKLLKTYNSTEFGVPSGNGAPPKYAWLGAVGVAGELPSGVITQDGVTYVPQTGRALQTEGVALIAIGNSATPFTRPVEAWVGAQAGEGAARELSKAEEERQAREAANKPPGEEPTSYPSWWCGGEYGPCEEGAEEASAECPGTRACTAQTRPSLATAGCRVWATLHFPGGPLVGSGYFECSSRQRVFKLQLCVEQAGIRASGTIVLTCGDEDAYGNNVAKIFRNQSSGTAHIGYPCANGSTYRIAAWGWSSNGGASSWAWSTSRSTAVACLAFVPEKR